MRTLKVLFLLVLLLPGTGCKRITALFNGGRGYSEKFICHRNLSTAKGPSFFSPDGRHTAYLVRVHEKLAVVVDGKQEKAYDEYPTFGRYQGSVDEEYWFKLAFSPDSQRMAYAVESGDKSFAVVDGKEGLSYEYATVSLPTFSTDSRRVAYAVQAVDKELLERQGISAKAGQKSFVVVDGNEGRPYDTVGSPIFSPDGSRLAYVAEVEKRWLLVVDGKEEGVPEGIEGQLHFSPDGRRLAYIAHRDWKEFVVVDDKEEKSYERLGGSIIFSPDSRHLAYNVLVGKKWHVVVDGVEGEPCAGVRDAIFSPDSRRLAYLADVGGSEVVVVDGKEGRPYEEIGEGSLLFSQDSQHFAYAAKAGAKWFVVIDGKDGQPYDSVGTLVESPQGDSVGDLVFSPDGQRLGYVAKAGGKSLVVVDGKEGPSYDSACAPVFSPDSWHVAYWGRIGKDNWFTVADGREGRSYDSIPGPIVFDSAGEFHYLTARRIKDRFDVYLVEEMIY